MIGRIARRQAHTHHIARTERFGKQIPCPSPDRSRRIRYTVEGSPCHHSAQELNLLSAGLGQIQRQIKCLVGLPIDRDLLPKGRVGQIICQGRRELHQLVGRDNPHLVGTRKPLHERLIANHPRNARRLVFDDIDLIEWAKCVFDRRIGTGNFSSQLDLIPGISLRGPKHAPALGRRIVFHRDRLLVARVEIIDHQTRRGQRHRGLDCQGHL